MNQRRREYSIYIDNLPRNLDPFGLRGVFSKAGRISDVYIPNRRGTTTKRRFGFVRFWSEEDAMRSILMFNNYSIRGNRLRVSMAKFSKGQGKSRDMNFFKEKRGHRKANQVWVRKENPTWRRKGLQRKGSKSIRVDTQSINVRMSQEREKELGYVSGKKNEEILEWLKLSLICTSEDPRDLGSLASIIFREFGICTKISALSKFKFIITFPSSQQMEEVLENPVVLEQWFYEIKKWSELEACNTRRVWIEVFGVPPQGWHWDNFKDIAERWGRLVCLDRGIDRPESFESLKILIDTDIFNTIEGEMILSLDDLGYRIHVKELGSISQVIYASNPAAEKAPMEAKEASFDVPGFEDVHDDMDKDHGVANCEWGSINSNPNVQDRPEREKSKNSNNEGTPREGTEEVGRTTQTLESVEEERAREDSAHLSSSRTESAVYFGITNHHDRQAEAFNGQANIEESLDSEATLGDSHPNQLALYGSPKKKSLENSLENDLFDCPLNSASPRKIQKSKAKRKKHLKEKCRQIEKKIKKKKTKKNCRQVQEMTNIQDSFLMEARRAWEVSKAVGLATKGPDEEVVEIIARNMAEEAEQRKAHSHQ